MKTPDGLLLIDKDKGCTSHDVVGKVRKKLGIRAVGHAGTLDPIASGLLVLLIGDGTKLSNYILQGDKGYRVRVKFGVETDTLDRDGEILKSDPGVSVKKVDLAVALQKLTGALELSVPIFSAVKVKGKKLYENARKGVPVEAPIRTMTFWDVKVIESDQNVADISVRCTKGSYIRAWVAALGRELGVGAIVEELRRDWSDPYLVDQAITIDQLSAENLGACPTFIPLDQTLPDWATMVVEGWDQKLLMNGQVSTGLQGRLRPYHQRFLGKGVKVVSAGQKKLLAILLADPKGDFTIARVFPSGA